MHNTGWPVALVMSAFAYALDARDPVSFIWLASAARFVYGMDRFLDGKTSDSDTPEAITLALFVSFLALHSAGIEQRRRAYSSTQRLNGGLPYLSLYMWV
jgi:hypothetical protein